MRLSATLDDIVSSLDLSIRTEPNAVLVALHMLDHHNCVGSIGNRRAGHDLPDGTFAQGTGRGFPRMSRSLDSEKRVRRKLGRAAGKSVACGARKGRLVLIR